MKLKYTLVFSIISFFITTAGFSQDLTDQEIGFDVARNTIMLKEHGVKDQDLAREIIMMREKQSVQYLDKKNGEDAILLRIRSAKNVKAVTNRNSSTAKVEFIDIPQSERDALIAIYNSTGGVNWYNHNGWDIGNPNSDVSTWRGVYIENGHVTNLILKGNNLINSIPSDIEKLTELVELNLSQNQFSVSLNDIVKLKNLEYVDLNGVPIGGNIPNSIGDLVKLRTIDLSYTNLSGNLPDGIVKLSNLAILDLSGNKLDGNLPQGIGQLVNLGRLYLNYNQFSGVLPSSIANLKNLTSLGLDGFKLYSIPYEIGLLTNLVYLNLSSNQLSGSISSEIFKLTKLEYLYLYYNQLNVIPEDIGKLINLKFLGLAFNQFVSIPASIEKLTSLTNLYLNYNKIEGTIPDGIGKCVNLLHLQLNDNQISGSIPTAIGNLSSLRVLELQFNKLSGVLPTELNNLSSLFSLNIQGNLFSGEMTDLTNLVSLNTLYIDANKFRFVDFATQYSIYTSRLNTFWYWRQAKTDTEKTVTVTKGDSITLTMYEDNRFTPNDTYQWYKSKWVGNTEVLNAPIAGAVSRNYTITNITPEDAADYYCLSKNPQITNAGDFYKNLILEREKVHVKVVGCPPISGNIMLLTDKPVQNKNISFALDTTVTGLIYKWTFYNTDNTVKTTIETSTATLSFATVGQYRVSLMVTDNTGCQMSTFEKSFTINPCNSVVVGNIMIDQTKVFVGSQALFSLDSTTTTGLTYSWTFYNQNNYPYTQYFTPTILEDNFRSAGVYRVNLVVTDEMTGCTTSFDKTFEVFDTCESVDRRGFIRGRNTILVNSESSFSFDGYFFATIDKFDFNWDLIDNNNVVVFSGTSLDFSITPAITGDYKVRLKLKEKDTNCEYEYLFDVKVGDMCVATEESRNGWIDLPDEWNYSKTISYVSTNTSAELIFRFSDTYGSWGKNWSYQWKLYDPNHILVSSSNEKDFHFSLSKADYYKVVMVLTDVDTGCSTEHTKIVKGNNSVSCANSNPKSEVVKDLYYGLLKSLISRSIFGETDSQINDSTGSAELLALKPYITNGTGNKIYNFKSTRNEYGYITKIGFSFAPDREYDVLVSLSDGIPNYWTFDEFNLYILGYIYTEIQDFTNINDYTVYCSGATENIENDVLKNVNCTRETKIRYIDFCPADCTPVAGTLKASAESPAVNANTIFSLEAATTGLTYRWTFYNDASGSVVKDGTQTTVTASQSYSVAGSYLVSLEVTEANGCTTKFDKVVNVSNGCISGTIETPKPATTIDGITVSFDTTATGLTYEWRFYYLNGTTSGEVYTTPIASRKFQDEGVYKVTLDVTDATGCKAHFEKMVTVTHLCTIAEGAIKLYPLRNNDTVVMGYPVKFDSEIVNATATSYDWTFYNLDGTIKENIKPLPPYSTEITQTYTAPGEYLATVTIKDYNGCPTTFEKKVSVVETCIIPADERVFPYSFYVGNDRIYNYKATNVLVNSVASISFQDYYYRPADVVYKWNLYDPTGNLVETSTQPIFTPTPTLLGDYKVDVQVTDEVGCSTNYIIAMNVVDVCTFSESTRDGAIYVTDDYDKTSFVKINESKELNFRIYHEDPEKSFSYQWQLYDPNLVLIGEGNQKTFPFTLTKGGFHKVVLVIKDNATGCTSEHTKIIGCLIGNSCTELNPKSLVVKDLYFNLLKNLISRSLTGETDTQINASPASAELIALKPYITNGIGDKIYNFVTTRNDSNLEERDPNGNGRITSVNFSFAPNREYDVHLSIPRGIYFDANWTPEELNSNIEESIYFNLNQYSTSNDYLVSCYYQQMGKNANPDRVILQPEDCTLESEVRYVDFCPKDCEPIAGVLKASSVSPIVNTSTKFSFETVAPNLSYNWTVTNSANVIVDAITNTTGLYSFIPNIQGDYTISLKVINEEKCETEFLKTITAIAPLPIVDCETHFNFNFKVPATVKGGILNNTEREHIANGIISFVNKNINEKLYLTTYDDHSSGVRTVALQNKYTTVFADATTNTSNETQGGFFRIQDDFYNDTFKNIISLGVIGNTAITKKIDVSFFVISEDNYADIAASKAAYADLLSSTKSNKIFFIFLDEGRFRNRTSNTYISPIDFASQVKGSTAINYSTTGNITTSDFISFSKAQIADVGFKNVLSAFLDKSYTQVKSKKCATASCVTTNPNAQVVKGLFINLVNKLQSLPAGAVTNGYSCAELIALTPFITFPNPAIYNYNQGSFSFSNLVNNNDVFMGANAQVTDVNLESYVDSESETNFIAKFGSIEKGCSVKHINFCPEKLCTPIEGALKSTPQVLNANVNASFSLETVATNLTYDWTFYNLDNTTVLAKATTALASQSFSGAGRYRVVLNVKDDKGCETPFETFATVLPACTLITGIIKIGSGSSPTPTPTPAPTQSYWYQAVHPIGHTGTDYVIYIDGNGVKQTYTLTRTESGYNAPCTEIIASSIVNHSGVIPCVLSCNEYEIVGGTNGRTISFTNCNGVSQTVIVPAGDSLPVCSRMVIGGATLIGPCDAGSVTTPTPNPTPTPTPAPTALIGFSNVGVSESFPGNAYPNGGNFLYAIGHADIKLDGLGIVKGDSVTIEFQYFSSFTPTHYYNISYPGVNSTFVPLPLYTPSSITIVYNGIDKTIGINLLSPFSQFLKSNTSGTASLRIVSVNGASMQIDTNNNSLQLISPATAGIGVTFKK